MAAGRLCLALRMLVWCQRGNTLTPQREYVFVAPMDLDNVLQRSSILVSTKDRDRMCLGDLVPKTQGKGPPHFRDRVALSTGARFPSTIQNSLPPPLLPPQRFGSLARGYASGVERGGFGWQIFYLTRERVLSHPFGRYREGREGKANTNEVCSQTI